MYYCGTTRDWSFLWDEMEKCEFAHTVNLEKSCLFYLTVIFVSLILEFMLSCAIGIIVNPSFLVKNKIGHERPLVITTTEVGSRKYPIAREGSINLHVFMSLSVII